MPLSDARPRQLGRYDVLGQVARGGMGSVYLGRATGAYGFEREVAIKLVPAGADATLARDLVEEAKLAVRIRHPNVVQIVDVGEDPAGVYLVMEYVEGDSVQGLVRRSEGERLSLGVSIRILLDALAGLHAAHELREPKSGAPLDLVHRDVSPHNLLVGTDGVTRLADFGIAKATSSLSRTMTGMLKGKFSYMGPEQARGLTLDRRADVWASGVIAWELFTGARLYPAGNDADTLIEIASGALPAPRSVRPDVPEALDAAVMRALTRELRSRCPTAQAFRQLLVDAAESAGIDVATPEEVAEVVRRLAGDDVAARRQLLLEASERAASAVAPASDVSVVGGAAAEGPTAAQGAVMAASAGPTVQLSLSDVGTALHPQRAPLEETVVVSRAPDPTGTFAPASSDDATLPSAGRFRVVGGAVAVLVVVVVIGGLAVARRSWLDAGDARETATATDEAPPPATGMATATALSMTAASTPAPLPAGTAFVLSGTALPTSTARPTSTVARPAVKPPACKGWEKCR